MNRQTATPAQISPLQVRQGLFFSLALLLTLIVGHLHHNWQQIQDARGVSARAALTVKTPTATATMLIQSRPAAVATTPSRERWVF